MSMMRIMAGQWTVGRVCLGFDSALPGDPWRAWGRSRVNVGGCSGVRAARRARVLLVLIGSPHAGGRAALAASRHRRAFYHQANSRMCAQSPSRQKRILAV